MSETVHVNFYWFPENIKVLVYTIFYFFFFLLVEWRFPGYRNLTWVNNNNTLTWKWVRRKWTGKAAVVRSLGALDSFRSALWTTAPWRIQKNPPTCRGLGSSDACRRANSLSRRQERPPVRWALENVIIM